MLKVAQAKPMPRFLFVSAGVGNVNSIAASQRMATLIQSAGGKARAVTLDGKSHSLVDHELGMAGDSSGQLVLDFIAGP
jgi:hypothetical protein